MFLMTVGAGVQWRTVYDAIHAQGGRFIVGGGCDTVVTFYTYNQKET